MGLRELRQAKGLTLKGLAALSGVNYMKIHQIETGKINPENIALKTAVKLAKALECKPEDILAKYRDRVWTTPNISTSKTSKRRPLPRGVRISMAALAVVAAVFPVTI